MTGTDWRCEICATRYVVHTLVADCLTRHEKDALHITD
jgi:hypothetical protein